MSPTASHGLLARSPTSGSSSRGPRSSRRRPLMAADRTGAGQCALTPMSDLGPSKRWHDSRMADRLPGADNEEIERVKKALEAAPNLRDLALSKGSRPLHLTHGPLRETRFQRKTCHLVSSLNLDEIGKLPPSTNVSPCLLPQITHSESNQGSSNSSSPMSPATITVTLRYRRIGPFIPRNGLSDSLPSRSCHRFMPHTANQAVSRRKRPGQPL
jgi:hypothetical protein